MAPDDLKQLNITRFERLLLAETDPEKRARIERLLAEEQAKDDSAYPADRSASTDDRPST